MIVSFLFLFSRINDLDHVLPIAKALQKDSGKAVYLLPRTPTLNFDVSDKIKSHECCSKIERLNLFEFIFAENELKRLIFRFFNSYRKGIFRKLQNRLFTLLGTQDRMMVGYKELFETTGPISCLVADYQISPKRPLEKQLIEVALRASVPLILVPHSYWHLKNGYVDFRRQYEDMHWAHDAIILFSSDLWKAEFEESLKKTGNSHLFHLIKGTPDRYSNSSIQTLSKTKKSKNPSKKSKPLIAIFETGGSPFETENGKSKLWSEMISALDRNGFLFSVAAHTRSNKKRTRSSAYTNLQGFELVLSSDVVITTYSSMAIDAILLGRQVIWPIMLGRRSWRSDFERWNNFHYVANNAELISLLSKLLPEIQKPAPLHFEAIEGSNSKDFSRIIRSLVLEEKK